MTRYHLQSDDAWRLHEAGHFTDPPLVLQGHAGAVTFYGALEKL